MIDAAALVSESKTSPARWNHFQNRQSSTWGEHTILASIQLSRGARSRIGGGSHEEGDRGK